MNGSWIVNRNVEIKARLRDVPACEARARSLADGPVQVLPQDDVFFACARGRLKLRRLAGGRGELISYTRPDIAGPRTSTYEIHRTEDPDTLHAALAAALGEIGRVRKERRLYMVGQTRVHIDAVAALGDFLELEVVLTPDQEVAEGEAIALRLMDRLGVSRDDLVDVAYTDLLRDQA